MKTTTSLLALLAGIGMAAPALAQVDPFEEILVTASKRGAASIQDIPYNISAVSGLTLERAGIDDLNDISRVVPGLSMVDGGPSNKQIVVRGLSATAGTEQVSVYYDEIPAAGIGGTNVNQTDLRLFDLERVEVLRGPQGTLYGAGSQAGTIRYIMNKPDATGFAAAIDGSLGLRARDGGERLSLNGMVNAPVVNDILAVRVVGYYRNTDGFLDRPDLGIDGSDKEETYGGRVMAQLNLGESTKFLASAYYQDTTVDDNPRAMADRDIKPGFVLEPFDDEVEMYNLTLEHDLGWGSVTATGSLFKRYTFYTFDQSQFTPGQSNRINQPANTDTYSAELRFASDFDGPVQVVAGLFYQDRERNSDSFGTFIDEGTGNPDARSPFFHNVVEENFTNKAIFGELTYNVTDRLSLVAGIRAFKLKRDAQNTLLADIFGRPLGPEAVRTSEVSDEVYRFQASYDISDTALVYATYSEGFREGGENPLGLVGDIPRSYDPDYVKNYEIGAKTEFFDRQLVLNVAGYFMQWKGIQVAMRDETAAFEFISNAGEAELYGFEIEGNLRPQAIPGFSADFSFRWSEQELTEDNPNAVLGDPFAGRSGERIPNTFPIQASLGVEQRFPIGNFGGYLRADVSYTGKARTEFNPQDPRARRWGDFFLTNVKVGIEDEAWGASLYARNLFNVREPLSWDVQVRPGIPDLVQTTQPREVGIQLGYRF